MGQMQSAINITVWGIEESNGLRKNRSGFKLLSFTALD